MKQFYDYETQLSSSKKKEMGIVYTPIHIIEFINESMLSRWDNPAPPRVLDPCCGTGVFLYDMAKRIAKRWRMPIAEVYRNYIFGIDLDSDAVRICKNNLPGATINSADSLKEDYSFCDLIVTNPPYVRIQNLSTAQTRQIREAFEFCTGDTDLYIAFFEKFAKCGKPVGMICPNSWIRNKSSKNLREHLFKKQAVSHLVDFGHKQVFKGVQVYTSIVMLTPDSNDELHYSTDMGQSPKIIPYKKDSAERIFINTTESQTGTTCLLDVCDIKIGLATLSDGLYFGEILSESGGVCLFKNKYDTFSIERGILKRCVKASKITNIKKNTYIIFPYSSDGELISETFFKSNYPLAFNYLIGYKEKLLSRDRGKIVSKKWYGYGRTQGLKNNAEKLLVPPLQKESMKLKYSQKDEYYISGYGIVPKKGYDLQTIRDIFENPELFSWVESRGKPMQNGWTGVSKEVFRNYKF
jgi:predicted RNA methylase